MRGGVIVAVAAVLLALAVPSAGAAQTPLPDGEQKGVRIFRERGALVVVFTQARRITGVLTFGALLAGDRNRTGYVTPAELLEALPSGPRPVVALAGPSDTPPAGMVGYYSDGARHAATVGLSTQGRRLFLEVNGDVLHTNIARHVFGGFD